MFFMFESKKDKAYVWAFRELNSPTEGALMAEVLQCPDV